MSQSGQPLFQYLVSDADNLLRSLCSNALVGVFVVQDGRFVYVNDRLADMFGYVPAELCAGMNSQELTAVHDRARVTDEIARRMSGEKQACAYEFQGLRRDGSLFDAEVFSVTVSYRNTPATIGLLQDISERRRAERDVADQLQFVTRLVDTIPNPVFYKDEKGRFLGCNRAFEEFVGLPRDQIVGRTAYDLSPSDLAGEYSDADKALFAARGTQAYEASVMYAKDAVRRDVMFYKATFDKADGTLGGLVGVILDISERKQMEQVRHDAHYDALTGLPNLRLLRDRLTEQLLRAKREEESLALLFVDLDRFKEVNDTLGHHVGDALLKQAARRISSALRATDTVARLGGDEFAVLLPKISDASAAGMVAQKILQLLSEPYDLEGKRVHVTGSIGIAIYPQDGTDSTLLSYADQAMYAVKAQGKNAFCYFTPSMQVQARLRLDLGNDLRQAVQEQQFEVHYQPIVDLVTGQIARAEALLRWPHPARGMVPPVEFISTAEEIGLIDAIGDEVFRQALDVAAWWRARQAGARICINVSPRQFISGSCRAWLDILRQSSLPPDLLSVEIVEKVLLDERPMVMQTLQELRAAGMAVSIDDFGTGYSALSCLKKFDLGALKIDHSFISALTSSDSDQTIVEAIIAMAHKLGLKVVAEGVETQAQCDLLCAAGCDYAQGYLFARPMPREGFEAWLAQAAPR
ncbi:bifunctional diguanylate cyclase/phosphodiesterase [Bordetella sp. FB-8]|uniref:putative bifunctional diguanylate cyclase/phosphodiesterase n=1 Tax=Bordetella sp. FB-8 TaxID=1159870 RepID=UPI000364C196|nr:EAL domain-containing protein [Bordetella sp. FB-8]